MKITAKHKRILGMAVLLALPLILFAAIREQNSWRPKIFVSHPKHGINWVDFSPDGKLISICFAPRAAGGGSYGVSVWEAKTKIMSWQKENSGGPSVFLAGGKTLVANGRFRQFWDVQTGHLKSTRGIGGFTAIAAHDNRIADGGIDEPIHIWQMSGLKSQPPILLGDGENIIQSLAFSPDGKILAIGSYRHGYPNYKTTLTYPITYTVKLWNIEIRKAEHILKGFKEEITSVEFSPDGKILMTKSKGKIQLWNLQTYKVSHEVVDNVMVTGKGTDVPQEKAKFSPDGATIASNSGDVVKLRDAQTLKLTRVLDGKHGTVTSFAFAPDGNTLMTGHDDGTVLLWRVR